MDYFQLPKSLVNFFRDPEIPQMVVINLGHLESLHTESAGQTTQRYNCNSIVLASHSERFRMVISGGVSEIFLKKFHSPGDTEALKHSIEFMYGDRLAIHRAGRDIIRMCKFADIWDIPSLRIACFDRIKTDLSSQPTNIFNYCEVLDDINWHHNELWWKLTETARENADSLMEFFHGSQEQLEIHGKICVELVKYSKTSICGRFLISLLQCGKISEELVLKISPLIPVATAFNDESELISFTNLFSPSYKDRLVTISNEFYQNKPEHLSFTGLNIEQLKNVTENPMHLSIDNKSCPNPHTQQVEDSSAGTSVETFIPDTHSTQPQSKSMKNSIVPPKKALCAEQKLFLVTNKTIRCVPIYAGLELVAMNLSRSKSYDTLSGLRKILLSYCSNRFLSIPILQDLKDLLPKEAVQPPAKKTKKKKKKNEEKMICQSTFVIQRCIQRLDVFTLSKLFLNVKEFCDAMVESKSIHMEFPSPVPCQICPSDKPHFYENLIIDLSSESCIDFQSFNRIQEIHKDHIIHCYAVLLNKDDRVVSYVSITQLPIPEIATLLSASGSCYRVKISVFISRMPLKKVDPYRNVLVTRFHPQSLPIASQDPASSSSPVQLNEESCNFNEKIEHPEPHFERFVTEKDTSIVEYAPSASNGNEKIDLRNCAKGNRGQILSLSKSMPLKSDCFIYSTKQKSGILNSFTLYTKLEILCLRLSKDNELLSASKVLPLIKPYFSHRLIPVCFLWDIKKVAIHSVREENKFEFDEKLVVESLNLRLEAFTVTKTVDCAKFCQKLILRKKIKVFGSPEELTTGTSPDFNVEIVIDLRSDTTVNFVSRPDVYKNHIIHCYILKLADNGTVLSYVSIMLLNIDEIVKLLKGKKQENNVCLVNIVVVLSKSVLETGFCNNILVKGIRNG